MIRRWLSLLAVSFLLVQGINACSDELNPQPLPPSDPDKNASDVPGNGSPGDVSGSSSSGSSSSGGGASPETDAGADAAADAGDDAHDAGGDT